jgi:uncharacterized membrane protein
VDELALDMLGLLPLFGFMVVLIVVVAISFRCYCLGQRVRDLEVRLYELDPTRFKRPAY